MQGAQPGMIVANSADTKRQLANKTARYAAITSLGGVGRERSASAEMRPSSAAAAAAAAR
ncbi:MAG: hypothetical protein ABI281_08025 [Caldimonas sp.]